MRRIMIIVLLNFIIVTTARAEKDDCNTELGHNVSTSKLIVAINCLKQQSSDQQAQIEALKASLVEAIKDAGLARQNAEAANQKIDALFKKSIQE